MKLISRGAVKRLGVLLGLIGIGLAVCWFVMIRMPGGSFQGKLPPLTTDERSLAQRIAADVDVLADEIGPRNRMMRSGYDRAADHIEHRLRGAGLEPRRIACPPGNPQATPGIIEVELRGVVEPEKIVVVGAHYDSFDASPGANDNASGVAAVLALAERFAAARVGDAPDRTLRLVFFPDEEPPHFQTDEMGSLVYAKACRAADDEVIAMFSIETVGYYAEQPGTQAYPKPFSAFYPDTGNFIGFVGNVRSRGVLREAVAAFRGSTEFPSEGAALPGTIPGVGWSDQWSFWQAGYPGLMITDTAPFRYPYYHTVEDTPKHVDCERVARVVAGVERVIRLFVRTTVEVSGGGR